MNSVTELRDVGGLFLVKICGEFCNEFKDALRMFGVMPVCQVEGGAPIGVGELRELHVDVPDMPTTAEVLDAAQRLALACSRQRVDRFEAVAAPGDGRPYQRVRDHRVAVSMYLHYVIDKDTKVVRFTVAGRQSGLLAF